MLKVYGWCQKAPKKHHTIPADVLPNDNEALFLIVVSCLQVDPIPHSFNLVSSSPTSSSPHPYVRFVVVLQYDCVLQKLEKLSYVFFSFPYMYALEGILESRL